MTAATDDVFQDPRLLRSQDLMLEAERAERADNMARARERYAEAGDLQFAVALQISGLPDERGVLAISAVSLFASGGRFDRAVDAALRLLAEPDALSPQYAAELRRLLNQHSATLEAERRPRSTSPASPETLLDQRRIFRDEPGRAFRSDPSCSSARGRLHVVHATQTPTGHPDTSSPTDQPAAAQTTAQRRRRSTTDQH